MNLNKRQLAKKSVDFFKRELLGPRLSKTVSVSVKEYKNLEANTGCEAFVEAFDHKKPRVYRDFYIAIDSKMSEDAMLTAIAHEMVHVKQYAKKELHTVFGIFEWNGVLYDNDDNMGLPFEEYEKLPWEAEAFALEKQLVEKFRNEVN